MDITIVSPLVIRVDEKEIDVEKCGRGVLTKVFKILLATFSEVKHTKIKSVMDLLKRLNDFDIVGTVDDSLLRSHVLEFMKVWHVNARTGRNLGGKINTLLTNVEPIMASYDSQPASTSRKMKVDTFGNITLENDDVSEVQRLTARVEKLKEFCEGLADDGDKSACLAAVDDDAS
jgi:hypothetical protein